MFLRPIATDVANLQEPLHQFEQATGLCTNIQKSEIAPISCQDINISAILRGISGGTDIATVAVSWIASISWQVTERRPTKTDRQGCNKITTVER
jgi:hypothetical protein